MRISTPKAIALTVTCALGLAACGTSSGTSSGGRSDGPSATPSSGVDVGKASAVTPVDGATLAKAKEQGSVLLYSNADEQQMKPVIDAFEAKYPAIDLRVLNMNDAQTFQRYATETATGVRTADVVMGSDAVGMLDFVGKGNIADYTDPNVKNLPEYAQLAPGLVAMSEDPVVAVYNTALIPKDGQPKDIASLAGMSDSLKGRIGTTDIGNPTQFGALAGYIGRHGEAGWKNIERLGPNSGVESGTGNLMQKLAQGQYSASYFVSGTVRALIKGDAAKVLNYAYLTDGTPLIPRGIGITKKARSPEAAKVFVNFLLSVEGQEAACEGGFTPYRDGVECAYGVPAIEQAVGADNMILGGYPEGIVKDKPALDARWKKAFGR
ncbi:ABC transporter substrate-binding protein [Streptomyces sp. NPDC059743]|uniref:ABC transporter substrate-binding protein n=1 Tax=Streptomyces sp. NPDC059743 TaxID=3346928 RepID=UPI00365BD7F1